MGGAIVFTSGGAANGGAGGDDGGGACASQNSTVARAPLDMYVLIDRSASMACAVGTSTRWDELKLGFDAFIQGAGVSSLNMGIGYFGTGLTSSCLPSEYRPDVEIGPVSATGTAILASLNANAPLSNTPTLPAIQSAISHAIGWKAQNYGHTVIVVLVTDGQPNACGTGADVANVALSGFTSGTIQTFVIGIVSPSSTCALDPNPPAKTDLDAIAKAGGTTSALIVDTTNTLQGTAAQFAAALTRIRSAAEPSCEYAIPVGTDPARLNVDLRDSGGQLTHVYFVDTKDKCDPGFGGWYFDSPQGGPSPQAPVKVILCPTTCATATRDVQDVRLDIGCPRRPLPP